MFYDLFRVMSLSPQPVQAGFVGIQDINSYRKTLSKARHVTVGFLAITAHIDAKYLAVCAAAHKAPHAVGNVLSIYPARPRTSPFGKNQQILLMVQNINTLFQDAFHFFPLSTATDRDAFRHVARDRRKDVPLKVCALRQIPGKEPEMHHVAMHRGNGISQDDGIDIGQMIGANYPGAFVVTEQKAALSSDFFQVPYSVAEKPYTEVDNGRQGKDRQSSQKVLQIKSALL